MKYASLRKLSVWWCEIQFFLYICICTYNQLVSSKSSYYTFCDLRSSSLQSYRQKSRQKERRKVLMEEKRVMPSLLHLEQAQPSTDSFTTLPWLSCYVFQSALCLNKELRLTLWSIMPPRFSSAVIVYVLHMLWSGSIDLRVLYIKLGQQLMYSHTSLFFQEE